MQAPKCSSYVHPLCGKDRGWLLDLSKGSAVCSKHSGKKSVTKRTKKKGDEVSDDSDGGQDGNESEESAVDDGTLDLLDLSQAEMKSLLLHLGIASDDKAQLYSSTFTSHTLNTTAALMALDWSQFPDLTPTAGDKTKLRSLAQLPNGGMDYIKDQRALKRKVAQAERRSKSKSNKSGAHKADVEAELLRMQPAHALPHTVAHPLLMSCTLYLGAGVAFRFVFLKTSLPRHGRF